MPSKQTSGTTAQPKTTSSRAADKARHLHHRSDAPALRGSDWPTNDLLAAQPSAASRKRSRTSEARADRYAH